jgi:hypothetical protein
MSEVRKANDPSNSSRMGFGPCGFLSRDWKGGVFSSPEKFHSTRLRLEDILFVGDIGYRQMSQYGLKPILRDWTKEQDERCPCPIL